MEEACITRVVAWIAIIKKNAYETNINSQGSNTNENPNELLAYKSYLERKFEHLNKAIKDENTKVLSALQWPDELMECIKDMRIRVEILDHLQQAFTINHFNKSPKHEEELENN
jgi:Tfp pilus assembly protein PilE